MAYTVVAAIEQLRTLNVIALQKKYPQIFGDASRSSNKQYLFRRLAWRLQANAEGGLSERARHRASRLPTRLTSARALPKDSCRRRSVRRRLWTTRSLSETPGCPLPAPSSPVVSMTGRSW